VAHINAFLIAFLLDLVFISCESALAIFSVNTICARVKKGLVKDGDPSWLLGKVPMAKTSITAGLLSALELSPSPKK
jgi:hypothetical protein